MHANAVNFHLNVLKTKCQKENFILLRIVPNELPRCTTHFDILHITFNITYAFLKFLFLVCTGCSATCGHNFTDGFNALKTTFKMFVLFDLVSEV